MPHSISTVESQRIASEACERLRSMKIRALHRCKKLYYNNMYDIQVQNETTHLNHTSLHFCIYTTSPLQYELVDIITQRRQFNSQTLVPYSVQEALLYSVSGDTQHVFNIIRDNKYLHYSHNKTAHMLDTQIQRLSVSRSNYLYAVANLHKCYSAQIYISNDCNTYCSIYNVHNSTVTQMSHGAMMALCEQNRFMLPALQQRGQQIALLPIALGIISTGIYLGTSNNALIQALRTRFNVIAHNICNAMLICCMNMYSLCTIMQ